MSDMSDIALIFLKVLVPKLFGIVYTKHSCSLQHGYTGKICCAVGYEIPMFVEKI